MTPDCVDPLDPVDPVDPRMSSKKLVFEHPIGTSLIRHRTFVRRLRGRAQKCSFCSIGVHIEVDICAQAAGSFVNTGIPLQTYCQVTAALRLNEIDIFKMRATGQQASIPSLAIMARILKMSIS